MYIEGEVTNFEKVKGNLNDEDPEVNCFKMLAVETNYLILEVASVIDIIRNLMMNLLAAHLAFSNLLAASSSSSYYNCLGPRKGEDSHLLLP